MPGVITSLLAGREVPYRDELIERDFMHIADVAAALLAVLGARRKFSIRAARLAAVIRRLRDEVDFRPARRLDEGLVETTPVA